jgi:superfamily II DNA or RNA helicase/HKD family nuclease
MPDFNSRLMESLRTSFVDYSIQSDQTFRPQLVKNDYKNHEKVLTSLLTELHTCTEFYFSVAFITSSGLATLLNTFKELRDHNIKGKILTTNYLTFTDPKALEKLLLFPNIEVRAYTEGNFHPKGYIFRQSNYWSVIIGSSNLTQDALSKNMEWNLKVISCVDGELVRTTRNEFDKVWIKAVPVTPQWISEYAELFRNEKSLRNRNAQELPEVIDDEREIVPNLMQKEAMTSLSAIRSENKERALLISATGTGKTYLAAFDVQQFKPKRFLFLVHRETIARKSESSFREILGNSIETGFLVGSERAIGAQYIFGMIQTISRDDVLHSISPNAFDYIVIDEAHRSGAASYQKIMNYFKPKFLLGLTATPERTDDFDIYSLFNHTIAYEIRLQRALELDMLCPFHYYGISEINVNGQEIDEMASFSNLVSTERLDHIVENIELYKNNTEKTKGLIFCSRIDEAIELSNQLNNRGYHTIALSGTNGELDRENTIKKLEEEAIDYIITVDIFNEGIDIPCVNQVVMLRPTQSAIIFVQQLGRGLRKVKNKSFLTVIDFIGNYSNNYMIPIALFGDSSYNHDTLRKLVNSGSASIPGASTIDFDFIARERIFTAINNASFNQQKLLIEEYNKVKNRLGRIPRLTEYQENDSIDPTLFIEKYGSYPLFLMKAEENYQLSLSPAHLRSLEFISNEICSGIRPHELIMIDQLLNKSSFIKQDITTILRTNWQTEIDDTTFKSAMNILSDKFFKDSDRKKYGNIKYLSTDESLKQISITDEFASLIQLSEYKEQLSQAIEFGLSKYRTLIKSGTAVQGLVLYSKYSRKDVCKLLNWENEEASTIYGYKIQYKTTPWNCPIFVTYNKSEDIQDSIKYEDTFIDNATFSWMTRNGVRIDSKEPVALMNWKTNHIRIPLFVKKSDGEGKDFYYMGDMEPIRAEEQTIKSDGKELPIVNILFHLKNAVRQDIFGYFENIRA